MNRLLGMGVPLSSAGGPLRPGIVHRLDAGTSGLMVVAKTDEAHEALVGDVPRGTRSSGGTWRSSAGSVEHDAFAVDAPLGRHAARVVVDATGGRPAETRFEVRERLGARHPAGGRASHRTNAPDPRPSVRRSAIPILGDRVYGGAGDDARRLGLTRPFLHSWRIAFTHPFTGERVELRGAAPGRPGVRRSIAARVATCRP